MTDYDPTTENEDTDLNWLLDNDDDDDDDEAETNTTQPFTPGAASTPAGDPYHGFWGRTEWDKWNNSFAFTMQILPNLNPFLKKCEIQIPILLKNLDSWLKCAIQEKKHTLFTQETLVTVQQKVVHRAAILSLYILISTQ